jgi:hypothetical protein
MRRIVLGLLFTVCAAATFARGPVAEAAPPPASTVIAKMATAVGGRDVLDSIKTSVQTLSLSIQGQPGTVTVTIKRPDKFLQVVSIPALNVSLTQGFDGTNGWFQDGFGHVKVATGDQLASLRCSAANPVGALLRSDGPLPAAAAVQPDATLDGKQYIVLSVSQKDCPSTTIYIDPKSYLVFRVTNSAQTIDPSNYTTGPAGEKYAKTLVISGPMGTTIATVTSQQDNVPVDDALFATPPIPSPSPVATSSPAPAASPSPATSAAPSASPRA